MFPPASGAEGGNILAEAVESPNSKIKAFLVDNTLPMELFERLSKLPGGKGGKKGKGKKGKKK